MAKVILNKKVEFAYVSQTLSAEFASELEKRYLYQKIVIIDNKYELSQEIAELIKKVRCDFLVVKDLNEIDDIECVACIVVTNCYNLTNVKKFCTLNQKPYIVLLTTIFDTSFLNSQCIDTDKKIIECNYPLGVFLLKTKVINKQDFICKFFLEISNYMFDNMQSKIDNLFFFNSNGSLFDEQKTLQKLSQNMILQKDSEELFNKIAKAYLIICINKVSKPLSLLDRVTELSNGYVFDSQYKIQFKYLMQYILTHITQDFFSLWTTKLKSTLDIEKHTSYLKKYNLSCEFKTNELPEQKIEFLLKEFRKKLVDYTEEQLLINNKIKSLIADINVDFLYKIFNIKQKNLLTDFICLEPNLYNKNSILKILSYNGLLNFDF